MNGTATRRLGASDLHITPLGIGTAPIGSTPEWRIYWGPQDEGAAVRAIQAAIDLGINWIDTAPFYGWGRAEQIVGRAIHNRRDDVYVFTKCGTLRAPDGGWIQTLTPGSMRREIEQSLRDLGTDRVDLYQFHDPDPDTPIEESLECARALVQEGKVRYVGISNHPCDLIERAAAFPEVVSNQFELSLLAPDHERDELPCTTGLGLGALAWSPQASGFLTDGFDIEQLDPSDFRRRHRFATDTRVPHVRAALAEVAAERGASLSHVALAWVISRPGITGAIVGIRDEREAASMAEALAFGLTDDEASRLTA
ncbi:MAG TPA: aldo/keto reductase [Actinomycetota bacterium]|nr:aldo/keto reductase [Actinomycetota bacterium]